MAAHDIKPLARSSAELLVRMMIYMLRTSCGIFLDHTKQCDDHHKAKVLNYGPVFLLCVNFQSNYSFYWLKRQLQRHCKDHSEGNEYIEYNTHNSEG